MLMSAHPAVRLERRGTEHEAVANERPLAIRVNGADFSVTLCSPGDELLLAHGLLWSEGVLRERRWYGGTLKPVHDALGSCVVDLQVPPHDLCLPQTRRQQAATSSCGACGTSALEGLSVPTRQCVQPVPMRVQDVSGWFRRMASHQGAFAHCGGTHAAAAFSATHVLLQVREDIGRHNAVDKVIGGLLAQEQQHATILAVSSRVSYEIMAKAIRAGFSCVAAVSAPSSLAIDLARHSGVVLLGFCRDNRCTVYHGAQHLVMDGIVDVRIIA